MVSQQIFRMSAVACLVVSTGLHAQPAVKSGAQAYPARPIRFVIPFGPGSASDALARIAGQDLMASMGQPIVVVPKPGADGALAGLEVKRAAADGYTFMFGTNSPLAVVPNIRKEPPYDVMKDFTPVSFIGDNTFFIVVHPSLPVKSVKELIAFAKTHPKEISYVAANTYAKVSTAMFARMNGIDMLMVPYKSEPDAMTDLLSGRVQFLNGTATAVRSLVKEGRLRALATTFYERSPLMPDVPSFPEAGQAKFPIGPWFALVGPAGLSQDIVARMNKEMVATLGKSTVKGEMAKQGFIARSSTPATLAAYMKEQIGVWKTALKTADIEPQ